MLHDHARILHRYPYLASYKGGAKLLVLAPSLESAAAIASRSFVYESILSVELFDCEGVAWSAEPREVEQPQEPAF